MVRIVGGMREGLGAQTAEDARIGMHWGESSNKSCVYAEVTKRVSF